MGLPYEQQAALEAILGALYHLQSPPGPYGKRYYSLIFRDLPDRREYPDYYLFIKEPRALNDIAESLRQGIYNTVQGIAYDLLLIWANAREYNQQGSQVYADADTLEQYMKQAWQERSPPLPPFDSLPRPGSLPAPAPPAPAPTGGESDRKVKRLKLTGASLGSSSTKIRLGGPATPAPAPAPTPATPTPTPGITLKLGGRTAASNITAASPAPLPSLPPLTLPNLPLHGAPSSASPHVTHEIPVEPIHQSGGERAGSAAPTKKESKKKRKQSVDPDGEGDVEEEQVGPQVATIADSESGWMSDDDAASAALYLDIVNKIRHHQDSSGRLLATPLLDLPNRAARPDYYQLVQDPVALSTIEAKIHAGSYPTAEAFDRDLHHLFETAKVFIRPESPGTVYSDLLVLQRLYHELTKRGAQLEAGVHAVNAAGAVPGNVKREEGAAGEVGKATSRPTTKDKVLLDGINLKGDVLRVGDWIFLSNSQNPGKPIIAQIWQTYKRADSSQRYISVCWYYRPEETVHPATRTFYENEVFKTSIFIDHHVEEFVGRCFVMFLSKYKSGRPRPPAWTPDIPLFVCEYRYKDEAKSFKKIKNWTSCVPEQVRAHEYDFEPYADEHVDVLPKVKSPFVRGVAGTGGLDNPDFIFTQEGVPSAVAPDAPAATDAAPMDLEVNPAREDTGIAQSVEPSTPFTAGAAPPINSAVDASLAAFDASLLTAPSPSVLGPSTPSAAELDTTDFYTPLPSALKSKFRNDALGDLLWFGAPAVSPPQVSKPTHSLAYLYWRVQQERQA